MLHINLALIGQAVSEEKIFEILSTDDGWMPEHGHLISSPCEPSAQVSELINVQCIVVNTVLCIGLVPIL